MPRHRDSALLAVHSRVFPFHGQRTLIADLIETPQDFFEADVAMAGRAEIPTAAPVAEPQMRAQDAGKTVATHRDVLDVDVVDAVRELAEESHGVDHLPDQVAGIEVEAEGRTPAKLRLELGGP